MGLGICVTGEPAPSGLFRRRPKSKALLDDIARAAEALIDQPVMRQYFHCGRRNGHLSLFLHPAEESVEIDYADGQVVLSSKTSSTGPGYHAWLVDYVDRLGERVGLQWDWRDGAKISADDTGYHGHRDYRRLQDSMMQWLRTLSKIFKQEPEKNGMNISMPLWFFPVHEHFAISSMGIWERNWFERIAIADAEQADAFGEAFFPAWHGPEDARYWRNFGLTICWTRLPWHVPANDDEQTQYQLTLDAFAKARELDPSIKLPDATIAEIKAILADEDRARIPEPSGIGFRRGMMMQQLTGDWSLELPGYYYQDEEDDGSTIVFRFGEWVVRTSSMSFTSDDKTITGRGAEVVRNEMEKYDGDGRTALIETGERFGWICEIEDKDEDTGEPYWNARGIIGLGNNLCIVTCSYVDREGDWDWALKVIRSVNGPEPS